MTDRFTVLINDDDKRPVYCQNCNWRGDANETAPICSLDQRISPGEIVPAGECPECGALAQLQLIKLSP